MSVQFDIKSNSAAITKQIERKLERQIPFVTSVAMNSALQKTRDNEVWRAYDRAFEVRNKTFFKLALRVFRSTRSQSRAYGRLMASVQEKDLPPPPGCAPARGKEAHTRKLRLHTTGGTKTPRGQKIAIPVTGRVGRTATGRVRAAQKPRAITNSKRGFRAGKYIMRRKNKKQIEVMYHLEPSAKIKRVFDPLSAVKSGMNSRMRHEFAAAWIRAIKTMR